MLNRRRHGTRVLTYFVAELMVVAVSNVAAYAIRQRTHASWEQALGPVQEYLWLLPASVAKVAKGE